MCGRDYLLYKLSSRADDRSANRGTLSGADWRTPRWLRRAAAFRGRVLLLYWVIILNLTAPPQLRIRRRLSMGAIDAHTSHAVLATPVPSLVLGAEGESYALILPRTGLFPGPRQIQTGLLFFRLV